MAMLEQHWPIPLTFTCIHLSGPYQGWFLSCQVVLYAWSWQEFEAVQNVVHGENIKTSSSSSHPKGVGGAGGVWRAFCWLLWPTVCWGVWRWEEMKKGSSLCLTTLLTMLKFVLDNLTYHFDCVMFMKPFCVSSVYSCLIIWDEETELKWIVHSSDAKTPMGSVMSWRRPWSSSTTQLQPQYLQPLQPYCSFRHHSLGFWWGSSLCLFHFANKPFSTNTMTWHTD